MQQIAKAAGVSYGLFYHYFRAKEDILTEAVEQLELMSVFREHFSKHDRPLREHLMDFGRLYLQLMEKHREVVWLVFTESRKRPPLVEHLQALGRSLEDAMRGFLSACQTRGEIRGDVDLPLFGTLVSAQLFMLHLRGEDPEQKLCPEGLIDLLLDGVTP